MSSLAERVKAAQAAKETLVNVVSAAMIKEPSFDVADEESIAAKIRRLVKTIADVDGEFILKLALWVRGDLGLRGTANLLVALAAYEPNCLAYLEPYVGKIANLPSDWLQMATFARDMPGRQIAGIPTALRTALAACFGKFNEYSLAKYNKEGAQKAKVKRAAAAKAAAARALESGDSDEDSGVASDSDSDDGKPPPPYTLKQMVRMLHISNPRYYIMCLLGKRYPDSYDDFISSGLADDGSRSFDEEKAGTRMRLAVPTTWETQLAARGNKPEVWDELVATQQLPFMAMLRNLRNIILAGCKPETHDTILSRLTTEDQIASSRQFPYRFFSAYDVLKFEWTDVYATASPDIPVPAGMKLTKKGPNGRPIKLKLWPTTNAPTKELITRYEKALDRAVQLATALNVRPISGRTMVIINVSTDLFRNVTAAGGARGIGSVRQYADVAALLGLMFKYACEDCTFGFSYRGMLIPCDFPRNGKILENMAETLAIARKEVDEDGGDAPNADEAHEFPFYELEDVMNRDRRLDALVVIDAGHKVYKNESFSAPESTDPVPCGVTLPFYLKRLRATVSPDLLFVSVDVTGSTSEGVAAHYSHPNDVTIAGFSDSILKFVAERGGGGPLAYIERIDEVKKIDTTAAKAKLAVRAPPPAPSTEDGAYLPSRDMTGYFVPSSDSGSEMMDSGSVDTASEFGTGFDKPPSRRSVSRYVDCRFFLSSTYLDMACERDALVLEVFPALRRRCLQHGVRATVSEVDLRWGITTEDAANKMTLSLCLSEVARCSPFFLGMVGARRGWQPPTYDFTKPEGCTLADEHFDWLKSAPAGLSVTELEFRQLLHSASLNGGTNERRTDGPPLSALVMLRDSVVTANTVPVSHKQLFSHDSAESAKAQKHFVNLVRKSDGVGCVRYRAPFTGFGDRNSAQLNMVDFKKRALAELWRMVCAAAHYDPDDAKDDDDDAVGDVLAAEDAAQRHRAGALVAAFVGREEEATELADFARGPLPPPGRGDDGSVIEPSRIKTVAAPEGAGKSSVIAAAAAKVAALGPGVVIHHSFAVGDRSSLTAARRIVHGLRDGLSLSDEKAPMPADADAIAECLKKAYAAAAAFVRVSVFLDDLEQCPDSAGLVGALAALVPSPMPSLDLRFVIGVQQASPFATSLRSRRPTPSVVSLPELEAETRAMVLRSHTRLLGRKLQESVSRGNQLLPLTKKAESGKPGFLVEALTYLRLFATFDTLDRDIRNVGSSSAALQTDMLVRFERRFGVAVCRPVLQALMLSAPLGGMLELDLQRLGPEGTVGTARQLLYALEPVLDWERGTLTLNSAAIATAIRKRYFKARDDLPKSHAALADFYTSPLETDQRAAHADPNGGGASMSSGLTMRSVKDMPKGLAGGTAALADARKELPYSRLSGRSLLCMMHHSLAAKRYEVVEAMVSSIVCIETVIEAGLLPHLLNAVDALASAARLVHRRLQPFVDFLIAHRHILLNHRELTLQCALNMPPRTAVWSAGMRVPAEERESRAMILWRNRDAHGESDCTQTTVITRKEVLASAFDEQGKVLAIGGRDWACRLYNVFDGTVLRTLRHPNDVASVVLLKSLVVTGCEDGLVRVWNRSDGALLAEGKGHNRRVNQIAVHPQGQYMLTCSDDGTVRRWGVTGESSRLRSIGPPSRKHGAPVSTVAIHSSGKIHASGGWESRALFWAYEKEIKPVWFNTKRKCAVRAIAFNTSMVVIAAIASYDGGVDLFDYAGEVHQVSLNTQHLGLPITSVEYSSDGKRMVTADVSGGMRLWRASVTGEVIATYHGHSRTVQCARFDPANPKKLISASHDATVRHWDTPADGDERPITAHATHVATVAFAPDSAFFVTAARDGWAHFVDLGLDKGRTTFRMDHEGARISSVAVTPDSRSIIVGDLSGCVWCWEASPGVGGNDGCKRWTATGVKSPVVFVDNDLAPPSSEDGSYNVWVAFRNGTLQRLNTKKGDVVSTVSTGLPTGVAVAAVSRPSSLVAWAFAPSVVTREGKTSTMTKLPSDSTWPTASASFSPATEDETTVTRLVAIGHEDGTLRVFNAANGCSAPSHALASTQLRNEFLADGSGTRVSAIAFADASTLLVGCDDRTIRVLRVDEDSASILPRQLFFATAPTTAVAVDTKTGSIVAGDALGNIYTLDRVLPPLQVSATGGMARQRSTEGQSITARSSSHGETLSELVDDWDDDDNDDGSGDAELAEAALEAKFSSFEAFGIITRDVPPEVKGAARRDWFIEQRKVLKIAMKMQRRSIYARAAMRAYAERSMERFGVYNKFAANAIGPLLK